MAGLDPATQPPRVGAAMRLSSTPVFWFLARTDVRALGGRLKWPAMTDLGREPGKPGHDER